MSNKTQLQTNNTQYASLIELLRGKATGGGGDASTYSTIYIGASVPTSDIGSDGDIYIVRS